MDDLLFNQYSKNGMRSVKEQCEWEQPPKSADSKATIF